MNALTSMDPEARAESESGYEVRANLEKRIGRRFFLHLVVSGAVFCMDEGFCRWRRQDDFSFVLSCPFLVPSREGSKVAKSRENDLPTKTSKSDT